MWEHLSPDLSHISWRKSSFRGGNGGECVDAAIGAVRDSKNPSGGMVVVTDLRDLVQAVKTGRISHR
ncbi:DUF397 domain-containing protein [Actinokineospora fastidiosa]|uniref:DUF397 domain-containing protein n=1 Tax=Actinokineospora fastidiosa TaxID=1816 RepID=UPI001E4BE448|nr:DUF397 domain-containing protein [Actinokineospora fastidiosa]